MEWQDQRGGLTGRVVLYGRAACHLCDVAREQVARVCAAHDVAWSEVDVDSAPDLRARYGDLVPVVEVDGHHHAHWRVEETDLATALARPARSVRR